MASRRQNACGAVKGPHSVAIFSIGGVNRRGLSASALAAIFIGGAMQPAAAEPSARVSSGLPVPRFVSLKSDKVNVRGGPTRDHEVAWIYTRAGLPVEVTAESENWRRIRDWEGAEGWVYHSLLSGRRTALVRGSPATKDAPLPLLDRPETQARTVARLQPGVVATVKACVGSWCRLIGPGFDGWLEQERLFGVYPNEKVD
jgi:SH3-like domain-containing protein